MRVCPETAREITVQKPVVATEKPPSLRYPCLEISPAGQGNYSLANRRCNGKTVLAVVETRDEAGITECKAYTIGRRQTVRSRGERPPQVDHECVLDQTRCTREHLGAMFPECDW